MSSFVILSEAEGSLAHRTCDAFYSVAKKVGMVVMEGIDAY